MDFLSIPLQLNEELMEKIINNILPNDIRRVAHDFQDRFGAPISLGVDEEASAG
jgi:hypothetical protein